MYPLRRSVMWRNIWQLVSIATSISRHRNLIHMHTHTSHTHNHTSLHTLHFTLVNHAPHRYKPKYCNGLCRRWIICNSGCSCTWKILLIDIYCIVLLQIMVHFLRKNSFHFYNTSISHTTMCQCINVQQYQQTPYASYLQYQYVETLQHITYPTQEKYHLFLCYL